MSTFSCKFDLVLYPFDEQTCGMEFQILNAPKEFLLFDVNNTLAENIGSSMLTEYEVSFKDSWEETSWVEKVERRKWERIFKGFIKIKLGLA